MDPKDFLASHDIAPTALRVQIVQILNEKKCPVSYDELVEQTGANKTTIYRNIALLEEKNLIITSENNHKSFYELTDGAKAYFICESCHKMEEISMPALPQKNVKSVLVRGLCEKCGG